MAKPVPDWDNSRVMYSGGVIKIEYDIDVYARQPWTRSGTTYTFTWAGHGLSNGVNVWIEVWSATGPSIGSYEIGNVTTDTFDVTATAASVASGSAEVSTDSICPSITIDTGGGYGSPIPCTRYMTDGQVLIIRIPTASKITNASHGVKISLPAGIVNYSWGITSGNASASVTDQGLTNGYGVEYLSHDVPEAADDMPLCINLARKAYWTNPVEWADLIKHCNWEVNVNGTHGAWGDHQTAVVVSATTGLPTSAAAGTSYTKCTQAGDDRVYTSWINPGLYTLRYKGTSAVTLSPGSLDSSGTASDGYTYKSYDVSVVDKWGFTVTIAGASPDIEDVQLYPPGYCIDGEPATKVLSDDWVRQHRAFSVIRTMEGLSVNHECNATKFEHFGPSTWKMGLGYIVLHTGTVVASEASSSDYLVAVSGYSVYEITHDLGDVIDTGAMVVIAGYTHGTTGYYRNVERTAANKFKVLCSSQPPDTTAITVSFTTHGPPIARQVQLCNLAEKDLWINVPHALTDAAVEDLAEYIRDNLSSARQVYVEVSNEVWNTGGGGAFYAQYRHFIGVGKADGRPDYAADWQYCLAGYGIRSAQVHEIFRQAFATTERAFKKVVCAHAALASSYIPVVLDWYKTECTDESLTFTAPDYYGYAGYIGWVATDRVSHVDFFLHRSGDVDLLTAAQYLDTIEATLLNHVNARFARNKPVLDSWNTTNGESVEQITYEGGNASYGSRFIYPSCDSRDGGQYTQADEDALYVMQMSTPRHPRWRGITNYSLTQALAYDVKLYSQYTEQFGWLDTGPWGAAELPWQVSGPGDGTQDGWSNLTDLTDTDNQSVILYAYEEWAGIYEEIDIGSKLVLVRKS